MTTLQATQTILISLCSLVCFTIIILDIFGGTDK